jgi:hypothetical protein
MQLQSKLEKSGRRNYTLDDVKSMMSMDPRHSADFKTHRWGMDPRHATDFKADPSRPPKRNSLQLGQKEPSQLQLPPKVVLNWPALHIYTHGREHFQGVITKTIRQLQNMSASQTMNINRRASEVVHVAVQAAGTTASKRMATDVR